jgi:hypothetical protein
MPGYSAKATDKAILNPRFELLGDKMASLPFSTNFSMAIGWGFLAIRPAPFEIGFTVNAIILMDW